MKIIKRTQGCCQTLSCCETSSNISLPVHLQTTAITVRTALTAKERLEHFLIRWGIGRMQYRVTPGLYSVGTPDRESPVLVTANYKLSFDKLRCSLTGLSAWIMVLDTKGINVWCAAGKGTFGTKELVRQIQLRCLRDLVSHRQLVLPQLAAPGVAAHEVKQMTGFHVIYGPVQARDLPVFLANDFHADERMRKISFSLKDRLVLVPMEFIPGLKYAPFFLIWLALLYLMGGAGAYESIKQQALLFLTALLGGTILFQILMPWLPTRSFALGGGLIGLVLITALSLIWHSSWLLAIAHVLLFAPITAFLALNFTGSTTFTSLSGVQKEMRYAVPIFLGSLLCGLILTILESIKV
jgi:hypothetical protein